MSALSAKLTTREATMKYPAKCQRKNLRRSDYAVSFTPSQWARLQTAFPTGVCNWSRRGYEQQDLADTWLVID
jgi:hypothetical protein